MKLKNENVQTSKESHKFLMICQRSWAVLVGTILAPSWRWGRLLGAKMGMMEFSYDK